MKVIKLPTRKEIETKFWELYKKAQATKEKKANESSNQ